MVKVKRTEGFTLFVIWVRDLRLAHERHGDENEEEVAGVGKLRKTGDDVVDHVRVPLVIRCLLDFAVSDTIMATRTNAYEKFAFEDKPIRLLEDSDGAHDPFAISRLVRLHQSL